MASRLPRGAYQSLSRALAVARDPLQLPASAAFWRNAFTGLGVTDLATLKHEAVAFASQVPDRWFFELLPDRNLLVAGCDDTYLIRRSGPLVSLAELARSVAPSLSPAAFLQCVAALLAATSPATAPLPEVAATGMICARELFDHIRRFEMCWWNMQEFGIPLSELLALYRQEAGLCIAPPRESYPYAPLIQTRAGGARQESVSLFDNTCARPGFNTVYSFLNCTDALPTDVSIRFDLAQRNLLALAGLDVIVVPHLSARDELSEFWKQAGAGASPSPSAISIRQNLRDHMASSMTRRANIDEGKNQRQLFDELCLGLLRTMVEEALPEEGAEILLNRLWLSLALLLNAHSFQPARPWAGGDVFLSAGMEANDTYECLRTQARWYSSRKLLSTLLAWKDRDAVPVLLPLSPFMTYLRFHAGDAMFVGVLLRVLTRMDFLLQTWNARRQIWGTRVLDAVPAGGWDADAVSDLRAALRNHWSTARVNARTTWHHLGLIEAMSKLPDVAPWLAPARAPDPNLVECARIANRLIEVLSIPGTLDLVSAALEYTPALWLAGNGFSVGMGTAAANILVKSHSFERLRLVYHEAALAAGLEG